MPDDMLDEAIACTEAAYKKYNGDIDNDGNKVIRFRVRKNDLKPQNFR